MFDCDPPCYLNSTKNLIVILLDETNSVSCNPGKQLMSSVNALFLANDFNTWLETGVDNASWWDLHNGSSTGNVSSTLYEIINDGYYGIFSSCDAGEPPLNSPTSSFWGLRMVNLFAEPGDHYVEADSSQPMVTAYETLKGKTETSAMLVNSDALKDYSVSLRGLTVPADAEVTEFQYGQKGTAIFTKNVK